MIPELESLKRLLRSEWDPIGVGDTEGAADEYDDYAFHIFTALHQGADEHAVKAYLDWAETENMGLSQSSGVTAEIASKIVRAHQNKEPMP